MDTDTMTSEEDQANAKKLHILKMLEKYYIYLNQEETDILKDILEDCKRRKKRIWIRRLRMRRGEINA